MQKKIKQQTIKFKNPVYIISTSSTVGPKEGEGPLKDFFDLILEDSLYGEISWEKAESKITKVRKSKSFTRRYRLCNFRRFIKSKYRFEFCYS